MVCAVLSTMPVAISAAETVPSAQSVLDEALQVVMPVAKKGDEYQLIEITMRQVKLQSCQRAKDLFRTAINWNEQWGPEIDYKINFLALLVSKQRSANCLEEMHYTAQRLLALYQKRDQQALEKNTSDDVATAAQALRFQLERGNLYLSIGDLGAAQAIASTIIETIRSSRWRPGREYMDAAMFVARVGRNEQALEVVSWHDRFFESREDIKEDFANRHWWIYRVGALAAVAHGQAEAGHQEAARMTLRRAINKARETPAARLTKLHGESARDSLGEGEALLSAGAMSIVWHAALIEETALALEAFELASPLANDIESTRLLIVALTKTGKIERAKHILDKMNCSSQAVAQGLLEKKDWSGALQEEAAYQKAKASGREWTCNVSPGGGKIIGSALERLEQSSKEKRARLSGRASKTSTR